MQLSGIQTFLPNADRYFYETFFYEQLKEKNDLQECCEPQKTPQPIIFNKTLQKPPQQTINTIRTDKVLQHMVLTAQSIERPIALTFQPIERLSQPKEKPKSKKRKKLEKTKELGYWRQWFKKKSPNIQRQMQLRNNLYRQKIQITKQIEKKIPLEELLLLNHNQINEINQTIAQEKLKNKTKKSKASWFRQQTPTRRKKMSARAAIHTKIRQLNKQLQICKKNENREYLEEVQIQLKQAKEDLNVIKLEIKQTQTELKKNKSKKNV